jgi:carbonic anhydrase/acetyltransferase-like protein (isoleucine patch superfamily)
MQHGAIKIGTGAVISAYANVQPGAIVSDGVSLGCLTLAMKQEVFPAHTAWIGSPARPLRRENTANFKGVHVVEYK